MNAELCRQGCVTVLQSSGQVSPLSTGLSTVGALLSVRRSPERLQWHFLPCSPFSRLEHPAWRVFAADNQQAVEGGVSDVWHLFCRLPLNSQCLFGCHGAPGVICGDAR